MEYVNLTDSEVSLHEFIAYDEQGSDQMGIDIFVKVKIILGLPPKRPGVIFTLPSKFEGTSSHRDDLIYR